MKTRKQGLCSTIMLSKDSNALTAETATMRFVGVRTFLVVAMLTFLTIAGAKSVKAQIFTEDWAISEPDLSGLVWGPQEISVDVRNNSGDYKFFVVRTETRSPLRRFGGVRHFTSNYIFVPDEEKSVKFTVDVPENLTYYTLQLGFFAVVDTLDDLALGKEIYDHIYTLTPPTPAGLVDYEKSLPKAGSVLKYNASLKTDLALLIHKSLQQRSSIGALSKKLGVPFAVLSRIIRSMEEFGIVKANGDNTYQSALTTIEGLPADEINSLIDTFADSFAEAIGKAMPKFIEKRQKMMDAGLITQGKKETLEGTGMMHHLFPLVGGIVMWEEVGSEFLIRGEGPPQIISLDAPCDMVTEGYGYILLDSSLRDGGEFYYYDPSSRRRVFGDHVPAVMCTRRIPTANMAPNYFLPSKETALMYTHDIDRVEDAVKLLTKPLIPIRKKFSSKVESIFKKSGVELLPAHRFWLWNRLVTITVRRLVDAKVLDKEWGRFFTWRERAPK